MWSCRGTTPSSDYYIDVSPAPTKVKSSSTITITCYQDSNLTIAIPSQVKWTRTHQGWSKKLPDVSHAYVCKPTDIGAIIEAEVTARSGNNNVQRNTFTIKFGPIVLDPLLRPTIENVIKNSIASFGVSIISAYKTKEYVLHITDVDLEIKDVRTGNNIKSTYSSIEPEFIENITDPCSLTMMIPKENENDYEKFFSAFSLDKQKRNSKESQKDKQGSLKIRFSDRESRDLFIITRKAFVVKRETRLMAIIQNSLDTTISNNNSVDLLLQMSTVKAQNQYLVKKKQLYKGEVDILQYQIQNIKNYYEELLVKQKNDIHNQNEQSKEKPRFDPMLSLLDSSNNSRQIWQGGAGNSRSIMIGDEKRLKLPVIGEMEEVREIKINTSENVMYSQVIPFNDSYSKKTSIEKSAYHKFSGRIERHNTIEQKQSSVDDQSILNSLNEMHIHLTHNPTPNFNSNFNPTFNPTFNDLRFHKIQSYQQINPLQHQQTTQNPLYKHWRYQADKNLVLQSKINHLQQQIAASKNLAVGETQTQQFILKQNDQLSKLVKEKDGVIALLVAETNNLKLQLDNNNLLKERYREKCEFLFEGKNGDVVLTSGDLESPQDFKDRLTPYIDESNKLMRESTRLNLLVKTALSADLEMSKLFQDSVDH